MSYVLSVSVNNVKTDTTYNSLSWDSTVQGGSHYGNEGTLNITNVNTTNKTITGTFEMSLCKDQGEYVNITGTLNTVGYTEN